MGTYSKIRHIQTCNENLEKKIIIEQFSKNGLSNQVINQIKYMSKNKILKNEKFTLVDDINNKVITIGPNYTLVKIYNVITGRDKGDVLKTQTISEFIMSDRQNFINILKSIGYSIKNFSISPLKKTIEDIDKCYFNQKDWLIRNTPSGIFKRAGTIENFMGDWLLTKFVAKDYGSRFITWKTLNGDTIPFGFHGTQVTKRLQVLDRSDLVNNTCKRNMSFGCINFKDNDIREIDNFIEADQISIWLPDMSNNIIKFS